ncbi:olfactory receptor [Dichotomocladium elegans]|nr:olfactory receptor [Dichotomocladium elegans]
MVSTEAQNRSDQYRRLFYKNASVEKDGDKYMTETDFLATVAAGEDFKKIQREQFGLLYKVADRSNKGLVSFEDFVIFQNLLSKPDAEYEIAFRLFDVNGTGKVTFDQFKEVLSSNMPKDAVPFDFDCDWLKLYIGTKEGKHELSYEEFSQLLKGLQGERLRQEFKHYDKAHSGFIAPEDFKRIILDIAKHKLSDHVIDHLPTLCNLYAGTGNSISFSNVVAFHNVIRNMDMVELIIRRAIEQSPTNTITKADFLNQAAQASRYTLFTPMEADIVFHFASVNGVSQDTITLEEFSKILDPRWKHPEPEAAVPIEQPTKKKVGFVQEVMENAYSFLLGSIAGAVGATSVYPIDLVKTRMQNQRSKVVGELLYKNSLDCFKKVIKNEGFVGLYRGLGPQLVGVAPEKAIKLTVNDFVRSKLMDKNTGEIKLWHEMLAGGSAGASQVVFTNPLEIVKIRLQVQGEQAKNTGVPRRSAIWIVKNLGIMGLYKGASACLLRDVPFSAIYFPAYAHLKKNVFKEGPDHKLKISELLMAGAIAGMPAAYFTTPADVIKTRLQVEARKGQTVYNGIADAAVKIMREEGFKAFFKGGPARIFRSSPQFGVTLTVYEILHQAFPLPGSHSVATATSTISPASEVPKDAAVTRSRNALKMLLDLDYRFGVYKVPTPTTPAAK